MRFASLQASTELERLMSTTWAGATLFVQAAAAAYPCKQKGYTTRLCELLHQAVTESQSHTAKAEITHMLRCRRQYGIAFTHAPISRIWNAHTVKTVSGLADWGLHVILNMPQAPQQELETNAPDQ